MSERNYGPPIGFLGVLTLIFITLRLIDKIDWSWWFVLSPFIFPIAIVSFWILILVMIIFIKGGRQ